MLTSVCSRERSARSGASRRTLTWAAPSHPGRSVQSRWGSAPVCSTSGAEGQMLVGGIVATVVGFAWESADRPPPGSGLVSEP